MPDVNASKKQPRLVIYGVGQRGQLVARLALQKGWPVVAGDTTGGPESRTGSRATRRAWP